MTLLRVFGQKVFAVCHKKITAMGKSTFKGLL